MSKGYVRYCDDGGSLVVVAHCYSQPGDLRHYLRLDSPYIFDEVKGIGMGSGAKRQLINIGVCFLESVGCTEIETEQTFDGL